LKDCALRFFTSGFSIKRPHLIPLFMP
jgi:hypothetical protein